MQEMPTENENLQMNKEETAVKEKKSGSMRQRMITGVFYVIVMVGVLAMKLLVPTGKDGLEYGALGVDLIFWLVSSIGSFEFLRAVKDVSKLQRWTAVITCSLMIPAFVIGKMITQHIGNAAIPGEPALILLLGVGSVGAMIVAALTVFDHDNSNVKSTALAEMCILYCGALVSVGTNINHLLTNSKPAILLLFLIVPFVDTFAFFTGKALGKALPKKLAPKTSPNKTVVGAVGGVIGGLAAGVITWVVFEYGLTGVFVNSTRLPDIAVMLIISLFTAVFAQLGDLFESAVKRGCGIKDMGKILPGHGGVLDRFDSMIFATVPIVVSFMIIR